MTKYRKRGDGGRASGGEEGKSKYSLRLVCSFSLSTLVSDKLDRDLWKFTPRHNLVDLSPNPFQPHALRPQNLQ
jgi:hypothetical protein